ncbi:MerR family transcriptional regulator [Falsihalocynthiibacter arcticus]|uniref:MerR family transcriptional regulator n=1 Tax=Falsihalocynthiibacter arcticus TaxID=1579316 RepID=UPI0009EDB823
MSKSQDAFRTISEVADWLETPAHVLRFWESRFTQVKPVKRAGGRRYYRPADMELLSGIKKLLHEDGMTIKGVQKLLRAEGIKHVAALGLPLDDVGIDIPPPKQSAQQTKFLKLRAARQVLCRTRPRRRTK